MSRWIEFYLYDANAPREKLANVDATQVIAVVDQKLRRPTGVWVDVANLILITGGELIVEDPDRTVARRVRTAALEGLEA